MRRHLTIFMLFVRSTIYRVLLVMALMVMTETALVYMTMGKYITDAAQRLPVDYSLRSLISDSHLGIVFFIAFVLVTAILAMSGCDFRGKLEYTIQRLGVSPVGIFFLQAGYNALVYALLWMVQVYAAFGIGLYFLKAADASWVTSQTLFLEFYRSPFLFSIFPMENVGIWITNLILVLCLGIVTARVPHAQRRRKASFGFLVTMIVVAAVFSIGWELFEDAVIFLALLLFVTGMTLAFVGLTEPGLDEE